MAWASSAGPVTRMPHENINASKRVAVVGLIRRLLNEFQESPPEAWANRTVDQYLEALAAWIEDCDGYYANQGRSVPDDAWDILSDALQAARSYE